MQLQLLVVIFFNVKTQWAVDFVKINDTILAENFKVDSKRSKRTNGFISVSSNSKAALVKLLDNQNEIEFEFASIML